MYYVRVSNNARCAVEDINPGGEHTILFVHGLPFSHEIFEYQYDVLPKHGIRCIGYDLRGYGDSDKPFEGYTYDRMADDLLRVIQSINCSSLTLLGFSMGGAVCTRYMSRHSGFKVDKLVLCGAACPQFITTDQNPYGMTKGQVDQLIEQTYEDRPGMIEELGRLCFSTTISDTYRRWFQGQCERSAGYAVIAGLECLRDEVLYDELTNIKMPTMILHGKKDLVCPFPFSIAQNSRIQNSFLVSFEKSGHCLFFEEKENFNQQLIQFVLEEKKQDFV